MDSKTKHPKVPIWETVLFFVGFAGVVFAVGKIIQSYRAQIAAIDLFQEMAAVTTPSWTDHAETPSELDDADTPATEPQEPYPGPAIDMAALREQYPDLVGWLWADGLWSLPVMQGEDNWYWLYHLPDGSWNNAGCLTMDCTTASDLTDPHTVVYGHNMFPSGMFHELPNYKKQDFYESHPVMYFFAADGSLYRCEPFAGYTTTYDDTPEAFLPEENDWQAAKDKSDFQGADAPLPGQPVLTLITCISLYGDNRYVLHCAMLRQEGMIKSLP